MIEMSWQDIIRKETFADYNRESAAYNSMYAEDAADNLPEAGAWPEKFDESFKEFRNLATQYLDTDERVEQEFNAKLNEIKEAALENWEKAVASSVALIERVGSEKDKAKLKENRHWMRGGTIRSQDELYPPKKKD